MHIEIKILDNSLIIVDKDSVLKSYQVSQIGFWGFGRIPKSQMYRYDKDDIPNVLRKLVDYLREECIGINLNKNADTCLDLMIQQDKKVKSAISLGRDFKDGIYSRQSLKEFRDYLDSNLVRKLKEHQVKAAYHLYLVKNGANFSVPGSGKTSVVLSVYQKLVQEKKVHSIFVVGPVSCFQPWKQEFRETFGRKPNNVILAGGDRAHRKSQYYLPIELLPEMYLTTYQTLLNDLDDVTHCFRRLQGHIYFVIDEAHYLKQINGNWASAALTLSKYANYRCVLTGTPIPRSYTDVFNMFDILWPNNSPINPKAKIDIQITEEKKNYNKTSSILSELISPLYYRVRKSDLGLSEPIFHSPMIIKMNRNEKIIYDAIYTRIKHYAQDDYLKNIDIIDRLRRGRIIRLRQCASHIELLQKAVEDYPEELFDMDSEIYNLIINYSNLEVPNKMIQLYNTVKGLIDENRKVIIWSNFIGTILRISDYLKSNGIYNKFIYGETPTEHNSIKDEETRESIIDEFRDPDKNLKIIIANPAACSESISLHKTCQHAIYYDLSYNCAQYLQSLDRIHRVGGSETIPSHYHFLQYENTIDQDVLANVQAKANRMYDIIEEDFSVYNLDMFDTGDEIDAYNRIFG